MSYSAQRTLAAPAQPSASLIRLAIALVLLVIGAIVLNFAFYVSLASFLPPGVWPPIAQELENVSSPRAVLIVLFSFALIVAALSLPLVLVHRRGVMSLIGPLRQSVSDFLRVCGAMALLYALIALVPMPAGMALVPHLAVSTWLPYLPLALVGLLIQTGTEELLFRGYLQSQLSARFNSPLIWIGIPSALFGALHYDPEVAGDNAVLIAIWAGFFGLAAADLTARTGTLGAAIALHFSTNFSAILIASPMGSLDGLALYTYPFSMADTQIIAQWLPVDALVLLCAWLTARLALKR